MAEYVEPESELESELDRWKSDAARRYRLSAEDRDLFLTGADEDAIVAQARAAAARLGIAVGPRPTPLETGEPKQIKPPALFAFLQQLDAKEPEYMFYPVNIRPIRGSAYIDRGGGGSRN